jgi:hypothetical protein
MPHHISWICRSHFSCTFPLFLFLSVAFSSVPIFSTSQRGYFYLYAVAIARGVLTRPGATDLSPLHNIHAGFTAHPVSIQRLHEDPSSTAKSPGRAAGRSHKYCTEIKNSWSYTSILYVFVVCCLINYARRRLTFNFTPSFTDIECVCCSCGPVLRHLI